MKAAETSFCFEWSPFERSRKLIQLNAGSIELRSTSLPVLPKTYIATPIIRFNSTMYFSPRFNTALPNPDPPSPLPISSFGRNTVVFLQAMRLCSSLRSLARPVRTTPGDSPYKCAWGKPISFSDICSIVCLRLTTCKPPEESRRTCVQ